MKSYLNLLQHILATGEDRTDRTGVGTRSVFGYQWRHNLQLGFPLLTTKKIFTRAVVVELLWFLKGRNDLQFLNDRNVTIWDEWRKADGTIGPGYGTQWRDFNQSGVVDQLTILVDGLKKNPDSRRHIVTAWNPLELVDMALPPCHMLFQCYVRPWQGEKFLDLHMYQRSCDSFLGLPFNIASYALLTHLLARVCGMKPGDLVISFGDLHIYQNHMEQVQLQLSREPRLLPTLKLGEIAAIDDWDPAQIEFLDYDPHPAIKAPVAV